MQWSPDTLSTFLQCALLYNGATIYTTVQCNELQILSDENFLHYKCCTVLLSSVLQTVQRYVQHLLKLCCSAVQCCTLKNAPICTELLFSDCPFQCSPLCVRRHLPVLNRWKVGFDRNRGRNPKSFQNRRQHLIAVSSVFVQDSLIGEKYSCPGIWGKYSCLAVRNTVVKQREIQLLSREKYRC